MQGAMSGMLLSAHSIVSIQPVAFSAAARGPSLRLLAMSFATMKGTAVAAKAGVSKVRAAPPVARSGAPRPRRACAPPHPYL